MFAPEPVNIVEAEDMNWLGTMEWDNFVPYKEQEQLDTEQTGMERAGYNWAEFDQTLAHWTEDYQ